MAKRFEKGSDAIFDFHCSRCVKDGKNSEAVRFCENCFDYLFQGCLNTHTSWIAMRRHKLLTMDQIRLKIHIPPTFVREICQVHSGSLVEMYCAEHDVVVCNECCETSAHRSCLVEYLPKVATKRPDESKRLKSKSMNLITLFEEVENKRLKDLTRMKEQCKKLKSEVSDVADDLLHSFWESVSSLNKKIDTKTATHINTIKDDMKVLKKSQAALKKNLQFEDVNEMQQFLKVHRAKSAVQKHEDVAKEINQRTGKETVVVEFNSLAKATIKDEDFVGSLIDELHPLYTDGDVYPSDIRGFCQIRDGKILATDYENNKLKTLDNIDNTYKVVDYINVKGKPWDVCEVEDEVVAVSCRNHIQFVNVSGTMSLKHNVLVNDRCRGMTYCGGKLLVCCGGFDLEEGPPRILGFDKSGKQLLEIKDKDNIGRPLSLAKSEDENKIFVADNYKGILILNPNGQFISAFTHPELKIPIGICLGKAGEVYTFGHFSRAALFKLTPDTKPVTIETIELKLKCGNALLYDKTRDRLLTQTDRGTPLAYVPIS